MGRALRPRLHHALPVGPRPPPEAAEAGVSHISSDGTVSGVPSQAVNCTSGSRYIIYRKGGAWYRGDIGHMGHKLDSWSVDRVASYLCNWLGPTHRGRSSSSPLPRGSSLAGSTRPARDENRARAGIRADPGTVPRSRWSGTGAQPKTLMKDHDNEPQQTP